MLFLMRMDLKTTLGDKAKLVAKGALSAYRKL